MNNVGDVMAESEPQESEYKYDVWRAHDSFFRTMMKDHTTAVHFFKKYLIKELSKQVKYDTLHHIDTTFIDEDLRQFASDVVFECDLNADGLDDYEGEGKVRLVVLVEHQSTPDKFMAFRVFHYMFNLLYDQFKQRKSDNELLPPIYPIIFYNGTETPYPYKLELSACFTDPFKIMQEVFNRAIPVIDVNQISEQDLKNEHLLDVMTLAMKFRNVKQDSLKYLLNIFDKLKFEELSENEAKDTANLLVKYLATMADTNELKQAIQTNQTLPESVRGEYMTFADHYYSQGIEQGIERGIEQGIERGIEQGIELERHEQENKRFQEKLQQVKLMLARGLSIDLIVEVSGLSATEIHEHLDLSE